MSGGTAGGQHLDGASVDALPWLQGQGVGQGAFRLCRLPLRTVSPRPIAPSRVPSSRSFDDNAAFRQPDLFALRDESQEDPR